MPVIIWTCLYMSYLLQFNSMWCLKNSIYSIINVVWNYYGRMMHWLTSTVTCIYYITKFTTSSAWLLSVCTFCHVLNLFNYDVLKFEYKFFKHIPVKVVTDMLVSFETWCNWSLVQRILQGQMLWSSNTY